MNDTRHDEEGIALVVSLLVMTVCVILVVAGLQLAAHTAQRSGLDRNRRAALSAAEAGINAQLATLATNNCPTPSGLLPSGLPADIPLPDANLPTESYRIVAPNPPCSVTGGNTTIVAVGYVPNARNPVASATLVARVNLTQGAPVSPGNQTAGYVSPGGYVFPDAVFAGTTINATSNFNAYGIGGTVPNISAGGNVSITGNQLDGAVHGWGKVALTASLIGGDVQGYGSEVKITNATVQTGSAATSVIANGDLTLNGTRVNGTALYGNNYNPDMNSSVSKGATKQTVTSLARQMPAFAFQQADINKALGLSGATTSICPLSATTSNFWYVPVNLNGCTYSPPTINGIVVLVVSGQVTVTVPQTTTGGQLYVVNANGVGDSITLVGNASNNSTLPVFAYTDGPLTMSGNIVGQVAANSVTATGSTITFQPPAVTFPDFSFNTQVAPTFGAALAPTVTYQYQCPGTTAC